MSKYGSLIVNYLQPCISTPTIITAKNRIQVETDFFFNEK